MGDGCDGPPIYGSLHWENDESPVDGVGYHIFRHIQMAQHNVTSVAWFEDKDTACFDPSPWGSSIFWQQWESYNDSQVNAPSCTHHGGAAFHPHLVPKITSALG